MLSSIFNAIKYNYSLSAYAEEDKKEKEKEKEKENNIRTAILRTYVKVFKYIKFPYFGDLYFPMIYTNGFILNDTKLVITTSINKYVGVKVLAFDRKVFDADILKITEKTSIIELKNCETSDLSPYALKINPDKNLIKSNLLVHLGRPNILDPTKLQKFTGRCNINEKGQINIRINKGFLLDILPVLPVYTEDIQCVGVILTENDNILSTMDDILELIDCYK